MQKNDDESDKKYFLGGSKKEKSWFHDVFLTDCFGCGGLVSRAVTSHSVECVVPTGGKLLRMSRNGLYRFEPILGKFLSTLNTNDMDNALQNGKNYTKREIKR